MRGINARWAHLARLGSQSEHRTRFILPAGAASDEVIYISASIQLVPCCKQVFPACFPLVGGVVPNKHSSKA